ncbi:CLUMA_CG010362, isoform A [Clunio marinus]|uniref:CLUMA_CG010362, isoform A n=1 Tax=Clunio marinus TaxID=568069 RepID=A0A1J1IBT5_9DIPT|nr:CLUMA_CG010362, isoform A [Clunio marinus]
MSLEIFRRSEKLTGLGTFFSFKVIVLINKSPKTLLVRNLLNFNEVYLKQWLKELETPESFKNLIKLGVSATGFDQYMFHFYRMHKQILITRINFSYISSHAVVNN